MRVRLRLAFLLGLGLSPHAAMAAGDFERGMFLARQSCNSCHIVLKNDTSWDDGIVAPRFSDFAPATAASLRELFAHTHLDMPGLAKLSDSELDDIAALIASVRIVRR